MIQQPIDGKEEKNKKDEGNGDFQYNTDDYEEDHEDIQRNQQERQLKSVKYRRYKSMKMLLAMVMCYNLSSIYIGYALVYFNSIPYLKTHEIYDIQLDPGVGEGLFSGLIQFGAVFGAFAMRYVLKYFSRRKSYFLANIIAFFAGIMIVVADMRLLLFGRFFQGFCVGLYSTLTPLVIKQLMPVQVSGMLGSLYMTCIIFGSLLAYILPVAMGHFYEISEFYKISFGFPLITIVIQSILLFFVYKNQTPKYLLLKDKISEAKALIRKIYKEEYWDLVMEEKLAGFRKIYNPDKHNKSKSTSQSKKQNQQKIQQPKQMNIQPKMEEAQKKQIPTQGLGSGSELARKKSLSSNPDDPEFAVDEYDTKYLKQIPVARGFAFQLEIFQQFTGVYVIALYGRQIIKYSSPELQEALPILLNLLRLIASLVGIFLISKFGRKQPMVIGTLIIFFSLIGFCIGFTEERTIEQNFTFLQFLVIFSFIVFTAAYACTLGPITYLYIPEIIQPPTIPFTSMVSWLCAYLMVFLFPIVRQREQSYKQYGGKDGIGLFIFFAVCTIIHSAVIWKLMIETKYRSEQQIRNQFKKLKNPCLKEKQPEEQKPPERAVIQIKKIDDHAFKEFQGRQF